MSKRGKDIPEEFSNEKRGIRIQKAMANAGVASRRECELLISEGRVTVNGKTVAALPAWVDPVNDRIAVDGQSVRQGVQSRFVYVMLNKPRGVITTSDDPQGRTNVVELVRLPNNPRIFPVGRLDAESTGLIILTNDGELAQHVTHPSHEIPKEYHVSVKGIVSDEDIELLKKGLFLATRSAAHPKRATMEEVKRLSFARSKGGNDRTRLTVTLTEGQNREIRRLLARLGYPVRRLERVAIGPLKLKGLASGEWRLLTSKEVSALKAPPRS